MKTNRFFSSVLSSLSASFMITREMYIRHFTHVYILKLPISRASHTQVFGLRTQPKANWELQLCGHHLSIGFMQLTT